MTIKLIDKFIFVIFEPNFEFQRFQEEVVLGDRLDAGWRQAARRIGAASTPRTVRRFVRRVGLTD
jgi:hypothetical protein